ncbi:CheR family methyltransferase [Dactylosporangium sp. NPDC048998]|uniref:CheR family methyltransferase n=1 Tax=Dactylosporangium sp. NPDC048998 TaxID=3363976 RepID=UPI0037186762
MPSIVGLDVNRGALRKAMAGRYSPWSLRETPAPARQRWFQPAGDRVEVDGRLRSRVRFVEHNVARDDPVRYSASSTGTAGASGPPASPVAARRSRSP